MASWLKNTQSRFNLDFTIRAKSQRLTGAVTKFLLKRSLFLSLLSSRMSFFRREIKVDKIFIHEDYDEEDSKANDIALLRLGSSKI